MGKKVLVVEDDAPIRDLYKMKLKLAGFEVQTAANGEEGYAAAEEFQPELILLDIRMPVMSGDEMLIKLRESEWGSAIKVIILTNLSKDEAPSVLRFLHVERYIVKAHHTPAQVLQTVKEVID